MTFGKKHLLLLLLLLLALALLCACEKVPAESTPPSLTSPAPIGTTAPMPLQTTAETTPTAPPVTVARPTEQETLARQMVETVFSHYLQTSGVGSNACIQVNEYPDTKQTGYLWSSFSAVGMQYYVCKLYPDDSEQKETFRLMINNFQYYRQRNPAQNEAANSVKYHSGRGTPLSGGVGDCFFDDNIWVARNYLRAYEILGDAWYLEEAIRVNNWVLSGWNEELGGVVWSEVGLTDAANEQHLERGLSANACAILVNASLSQLVDSPEEQKYYLQWAEKFYTFCKKMQNTPISYDYWNGIHTIIVNGVRKNGGINRVHYAYNSGSMILANLALYEATTDEVKKDAYRKDALATAAAAQKTFYLRDGATGEPYYQGDPWFAAILNEAFYELRRYDKALADEYLDAFYQNVKTAYQNRDISTGLCPYQATQSAGGSKNEFWVIHQIGYAEQAVLAALYSLETP